MPTSRSKKTEPGSHLFPGLLAHVVATKVGSKNRIISPPENFIVLINPNGKYYYSFNTLTLRFHRGGAVPRGVRTLSEGRGVMACVAGVGGGQSLVPVATFLSFFLWSLKERNKKDFYSKKNRPKKKAVSKFD